MQYLSLLKRSTEIGDILDFYFQLSPLLLLVFSPLLLLKTRVMTDHAFREKGSMWETTVASARIGARVVSDEGVSALMKGSIIFSGKRVADWSTRYFFSVMAENHLFQDGDQTKKLSTSQKMTASMIGGITSAFFTIPIDVVVAQIQQASKAGQKVHILDIFSEELKKGGIKHLIYFSAQGFIARALHVALTTALMKTATSAVYDWYYDRH